MDTATASLLVILVVGLVVVGFFQVFRNKGKAAIKGPFGIAMDVEGRNESEASVRAKDVTSRSGGFSAVDETGKGISIEKVDVRQDIRLSNKGEGENNNPKC